MEYFLEDFLSLYQNPTLDVYLTSLSVTFIHTFISSTQ